MIDGQILQPSEVENWVRLAFPFQSYKVRIYEREEPDKGRVHVTTQIIGPHDEELRDRTGRVPRYFTFRRIEGMDQIEQDWAV